MLLKEPWLQSIRENCHDRFLRNKIFGKLRFHDRLIVVRRQARLIQLISKLESVQCGSDVQELELWCSMAEASGFDADIVAKTPQRARQVRDEERWEGARACITDNSDDWKSVRYERWHVNLMNPGIAVAQG